MSESLSEAGPHVEVNGQRLQQGQDGAVEECVSSVSLEEDCVEDAVAAARGTPSKMQSVFQQVRLQLRSQVSAKAPKNSILELVQKIKDREAAGAQASNAPEGKDVSEEKEDQEERLTEECKDQMNQKEEEKLCAILEGKFEASKKALMEEFQEQISQVRKEMQAYTDQALRDLESKMQTNNLQQPRVSEQQEGRAADRKQKPAAAPSLASRRGRVLTRTMTTIIPKTCAPVVIGPRAKSETLLTSSKAKNSSTFLPRDAVLPLPGNKPYRSCKPLPPAPHPPLQQGKKSVQAKTKTGALLGLGDKSGSK